MSDMDRIVVTVPARSEFARTVRLVSGELASRVGMSVDGVDDLKLAAEESFVLACGYADLETVTFTFMLYEDRVELEVGTLSGTFPEEGPGEAGERYARFILEAVCDEYEMIERDGSCFVRLVKRIA